MRKLSAGVLVAVLLIASAACTKSSTPAASADQTSSTASLADATPLYREGVYGVTVDEGGCTLEGLEGPVDANKLRFNMWNSSAQYPVTFDIGRIDRDSTYEDLVAFVEDERAADTVGVLRPPYFESPLRGTVDQGNGMNIPSGRLITMLSTESDPAAWEPLAGSGASLHGTYAVVCYRGSVAAREAIGVVGPVIVR